MPAEDLKIRQIILDDFVKFFFADLGIEVGHSVSIPGHLAELVVGEGNGHDPMFSGDSPPER